MHDMRDLFPGYYRPREAEFDILWRECTFAFDANVLLNIYRYSQDTRDAFLNILNLLKDRIWLPHQAASEYQSNRLTVLSAQLKAYNDIPRILSSMLAEIKSSYPRHPFIDLKQITAALSKTIDEISASLETAKSSHPDLSESDELREALTEIFSGRVGAPYAEEELTKIYQEGDKRFQKQIPPGFKDMKKEDDKKYGDFVLWKQLKNYGKESGRPIVLVTDDRKEDWWQEYQGKTIGPRPELVQEMRSEADISFYMYQSDRFIEHAQKFLGITEEKVLKEVREVKEQDKVLEAVGTSSTDEVVFQGRVFTREQYESATQLLNVSISEISALTFIAQEPRTFKQLRDEMFDGRSPETRLFVAIYTRRGVITAESEPPNRFILTDFGRKVLGIYFGLKIESSKRMNPVF